MGKSDKSSVVRELEKQVRKLEKTVRGLEQQVDEYQAEATRASKEAKKAKKAVKVARRAADTEVAKAKAKAKKRVDKVLAAAQGPRPEPHGDIPVDDAAPDGAADGATAGDDEVGAGVVVLLPSTAEQAVGTTSVPTDVVVADGEGAALGELESALVPNAAWSVTQLRVAARERGIVGYSRKSKAQLLVELA